MMSAKQIILTTGDSDGIGLEVTLKALIRLKPQRGIRFAFFQDPKIKSPLFKKLERHFDVTTISSLQDLSEHQKIKSNQIFQILQSSDATQWFKDACRYCLSDVNAAVVTGPLSKIGMRNFGHAELGHTEILKKFCKTDLLFQAYLGSKFNVILVTDHIPISSVSKKLLHSERFLGALKSALIIKKKLRLYGKIALLGLNPHASEFGLIGNEEAKLLKIVRKLDPSGKIFTEFMPADSAFIESNIKKHSLFVALYHDQGLIPFKSLHGFDEGVHLTSGIPFVRTSVDHGTAKEIFGKDLAHCGSMFHAIKSAITLLRKT